MFIAEGTQKTVTGAGQPDESFLFRIAPAESLTWSPGRYGWQRTATNGTDTYTTASGATEVLPSYAAQVSGGDPRSIYEQNIAAIDAVLQNRITADVQSYTINGRQLTKLSIAELLQLRSYYSQLLNKYLQETGQGGQSRIVRTVI